MLCSLQTILILYYRAYRVPGDTILYHTFMVLGDQAIYSIVIVF